MGALALSIVALLLPRLGCRRGQGDRAMDEFDCFQCGRGGADEHIGLCALCFASLDPYTRKRAEHFAIQAALVRQALIEEEGMGARWSEQQYREYLRRAQAPAPREDRKAYG